jgi:hypothetical protein
MEAFAHTLLRPTRRITRAIAATVVLALVAWLGVSATHLHLPGPVESRATLDGSPGHGHLHDGHACAHAHAGLSGQSLPLVHIDHLGESSPLDLPGDAGPPGDDGSAGRDGHLHPFGDHEHRPGTHPCSLCLSLDRGAGPSAPPAIVVAIVAATFHVRVPDDPVPSVASPTVYRSRAPPVA